MQLHTFTARSLADALRLVRDQLGPDASLLHTREIGSPLVRFFGGRRIEVTASVEVEVPSRLPATSTPHDQQVASRVPAADLQDFRRQFRHDLQSSGVKSASLVEQMSQVSTSGRP